MSKGANKRKPNTISAWKNEKEKYITYDIAKKKSGIGKKIVNYIFQHQIELPLKIISAIILSYLVNPTPQNPFSKFLFLSYPVQKNPSDEVLYGKGYWDIAYIVFWILVLTFVREFTMQHLLKPFAIYAGIKAKSSTRFMEQGYIFIYCLISTSVGAYIMRQSPYWYFNTKYFWIDYPHFLISPLVKNYYLIQFGFWFQQITVLLLKIEKPRKDFVEMAAHHVITCLLIGGSYLSNFTRTGNAVFVTMDFTDIWLSFAKCLKYLELPSVITDMMFVVFMITWVYTRHYLYGLIIWSTYAESCLPENNKCIWDPLNGYWLTRWSKYIILFGLVLLQILMIYWFLLILRVAWRVITGKNAEDTRSDSEE
ncbi:TLC domain-containing protein [Glomus cerebriforme]|uniref:TLC domain-containing protein n=1 Tax=Glomus cerebriforme TaxID=658196 RepID=A0A397T623_9GLOM|nr:TLC domain-containing protein [Glomus cerebriforme]